MNGPPNPQPKRSKTVLHCSFLKIPLAVSFNYQCAGKKLSCLTLKTKSTKSTVQCSINYLNFYYRNEHSIELVKSQSNFLFSSVNEFLKFPNIAFFLI